MNRNLRRPLVTLRTSALAVALGLTAGFLATYATLEAVSPAELDDAAQDAYEASQVTPAEAAEAEAIRARLVSGDDGSGIKL